MLKIALSLFLIIGPVPEASTKVAEIVDQMVAHDQRQDQTLIGFSTLRKFFAADMRFKTLN
jgi:hypothetical protein